MSSQQVRNGWVNYSAYIQSEEWKRRAEGMKWLVGHKCQLCGEGLYLLEVHHNNYDRLGDERPEDLMVLCSLCHALHEYLKRNGRHVRDWLKERIEHTKKLRIRIDSIANYIDDELLEIDNQLAQVTDAVEGLLYMVETRAANQRRVAEADERREQTGVTTLFCMADPDRPGGSGDHLTRFWWRQATSFAVSYGIIQPPLFPPHGGFYSMRDLVS